MFAALKLDAAPSNNMGLSSNAISEGYEDYVAEWIANDLEKHEKCNVDDMLAYFLKQCLHGQTPASKNTSSTFLQPYLEAVLPICNNVEIMSQLTE
ncbi:hypothetical protein HETIRDRAFT_109128 [Heterobasidion irregulare TC 32-1]|uniref:Uncharacterized protein n=1 Tax=Heterobasidion irregulare (strain TC 32-1) TaxID=747525 RepID=W4KDP6_HETIT|nr:uncharacterized protein HETIRDRAFT_109128 [Heterobasidion irregulare TC 32-1]ETW83440.1 hypothetical protein HETIRDRAFT_109128 [Heterobasidion irregulare TC 32-1]